MFLFSGKTNITLESVAVSSDEEFIACFENGIEYKIHCFRSDGSLAFDFKIPPELSAGGHCTLWFDKDVLCVQFYRTNKTVYFALDGTIQNIADNATEESSSEFPSFLHKRHQYIFDGKKIDVVYNERSFLGYWFFGAERYLAIMPKNDEIVIAYAWTATGGLTN